MKIKSKWMDMYIQVCVCESMVGPNFGGEERGWELKFHGELSVEEVKG